MKNHHTKLISSFIPFRLATILLLHCGLAHAQSATATLSGTVVDPQNANIAGAAVKAVNAATNLERKTTTNNDGYFSLPLLPPGNYTLNVERQGFASIDKRDVILNVGDQRSLLIQLRVGEVAATVNVTGEGALLNESAAVGTVVDRQFVANLPLNGRSFQSLILLTPGVVPTAATTARQGQFSVNGQRESTNYVTVDGVSANIGISLNANPFGGEGQYAGYNAQGGTNSLVSLDALQEFKILTSTFAPEFGRTPGAQVSLVTRSGGNEFHGTLFEYFRNDALDANDFFANSRRLAKPPLRQNLFGGTFSGPLLLPRFGEGRPGFYHGHNRTFFFFSYEGLRLRLPQVAIRQVPTLSARQKATVAGQTILNAFPLPTGQDLGNGLAEYAASYSDPSELDAVSIRLDHKVNDRLTLFGRYNHAPSDNAARGVSNRAISNSQLTRNNIQTVTLGATAVFNSRASDDMRVNYSRNRGANFSVADTFGGAVVPNESLLFPPFTSSQQSQFVAFLTSSFTPVLNIGKRSENTQAQFNLVDTFSLVIGAHQIKFGGDYRRMMPALDFTQYSQNVFFNSIDQVAQGIAARAIISFFANPARPRYHNLSLFAQDTWRVKPRLTLTYGLRYEINPPPSAQNGISPRTALGIDHPLTATLAPEGTPLFETTYNNFVPRVGAAYQWRQSPRFSTVLRGGFGVFYDLTSGQASTAYDPFYFPFSRQTTIVNAALPFNPTLVVPPNSQSPPYQSILAFGPDFKLPYTLQFNFAIEQSLGANQTVSATYVSALGRRLYRTESYVSPNATFQDLDVINNSASSDYHALQLQFTRRLSRGLQALASYTWSHSIDTASSDLSTGNLPASQSSVSQNRGASDFDRRHSFNVAATYNIPAPGLGSVGNALLRDFSIDLLYRALSAEPVNLFTSFSRPNSISSIQIRPDLVPGVPLYINDPAEPGGRRFNRAAFVIVPSSAGRQGTLARNVLRGFGVSQLDVALHRQFNFTERLNAQLKVEVFNAFNHANFADPQGNVSNSFFGRTTQLLNRGLGGLGPLYQIGGPRSMQLSFRLQF